MIKLTAITCGWFTAPASFFADQAVGKWRAPVPAFLIEHPKGKVLFDTGLSPRFRNYMETSPSAAMGFGCELQDEHEIGARLRAMGINPDDIDLVAMSHLHHDHAAGLASIPNATLLIQAEEYDYAMADLDRHYDKSYFDLGHKVKKISGEFDVFGDDRLVLFPTPGHSPGHQSARVRLNERTVVLAADCCYVGEVLDKLNLAPGSHDREQHLKSLQLLRELRQKGCQILFGHDKDQAVLTAESPTEIH